MAVVALPVERGESGPRAGRERRGLGRVGIGRAVHPSQALERERRPGLLVALDSLGATLEATRGDELELDRGLGVALPASAPAKDVLLDREGDLLGKALRRALGLEPPDRGLRLECDDPAPGRLPRPRERRRVDCEAGLDLVGSRAVAAERDRRHSREGVRLLLARPVFLAGRVPVERLGGARELVGRLEREVPARVDHDAVGLARLTLVEVVLAPGGRPLELLTRQLEAQIHAVKSVRLLVRLGRVQHLADELAGRGVDVETDHARGVAVALPRPRQSRGVFTLGASHRRRAGQGDQGRGGGEHDPRTKLRHGVCPSPSI